VLPGPTHSWKKRMLGTGYQGKEEGEVRQAIYNKLLQREKNHKEEKGALKSGKRRAKPGVLKEL